MQRDMDLIREILMAVEQSAYGQVGESNFPGHDPVVVAYHIDLLDQAGLVQAAVARSAGHGPVKACVSTLTWHGHEFLDAVRSETIWSKVKEKAGAASFEVLMAVAVSFLKAQAGI